MTLRELRKEYKRLCMTPGFHPYKELGMFFLYYFIGIMVVQAINWLITGILGVLAILPSFLLSVAFAIYTQMLWMGYQGYSLKALRGENYTKNTVSIISKETIKAYWPYGFIRVLLKDIAPFVVMVIVIIAAALNMSFAGLVILSLICSLPAIVIASLLSYINLHYYDRENISAVANTMESVKMATGDLITLCKLWLKYNGLPLIVFIILCTSFCARLNGIGDTDGWAVVFLNLFLLGVAGFVSLGYYVWAYPRYYTQLSVVYNKRSGAGISVTTPQTQVSTEDVFETTSGTVEPETLK